MTDTENPRTGAADAGPGAEREGSSADTRRAFIERLARTTALPMVLPLLFVRPKAPAAAY